jgi:chromosome segregation ATPase
VPRTVTEYFDNAHDGRLEDGAVVHPVTIPIPSDPNTSSGARSNFDAQTQIQSQTQAQNDHPRFQPLDLVDNMSSSSDVFCIGGTEAEEGVYKHSSSPTPSPSPSALFHVNGSGPSLTEALPERDLERDQIKALEHLLLEKDKGLLDSLQELSLTRDQLSDSRLQTHRLTRQLEIHQRNSTKVIEKKNAALQSLDINLRELVLEKRKIQERASDIEQAFTVKEWFAEELVEQKEALQEKLDQLKKENDRLKKEVSTRNGRERQLHRETEQIRVRLETENTDLRAIQAQNEEQRSALCDRVEVLERNLSVEGHSSRMLNMELNKAKKELQRQRQELREKTETCDRLARELMAERTKVEDKERELDRLRYWEQDRSNFQRRHDELKGLYNRGVKEHREFTVAAKEKEKELMREVEVLKEKGGRDEEEKERLENQLQIQDIAIKYLKMESLTAKREVSSLQDKVKEVNGAVERLKNQVEAKEQELNVLRTQATTNKNDLRRYRSKVQVQGDRIITLRADLARANEQRIRQTEAGD